MPAAFRRMLAGYGLLFFLVSPAAAIIYDSACLAWSTLPSRAEKAQVWDETGYADRPGPIRGHGFTIPLVWLSDPRPVLLAGSSLATVHLEGNAISGLPWSGRPDVSSTPLVLTEKNPGAKHAFWVADHGMRWSGGGTRVLKGGAWFVGMGGYHSKESLPSSVGPLKGGYGGVDAEYSLAMKQWLSLNLTMLAGMGGFRQENGLENVNAFVLDPYLSAKVRLLSCLDLMLSAGGLLGIPVPNTLGLERKDLSSFTTIGQLRLNLF